MSYVDYCIFYGRVFAGIGIVCLAVGKLVPPVTDETVRIGYALGVANWILGFITAFDALGVQDKSMDVILNLLVLGIIGVVLYWRHLLVYTSHT